jgi:GH25 family lysozyme M1 (1,4-beta-N-acetylmuramidase)
VKHTEGNEGCDGRARANREGALAAGIYAGAYLYGFPLPTDPRHPGRSPKEQVERFWDDSRGLGTRPGELPPALDMEWPPKAEWIKDPDPTTDVWPDGRKKLRDTSGKILDAFVWQKWGVDGDSIVDWTLECLFEIERRWSRVPVFYTYEWFWESLGARRHDPAFARCPLWIPYGGSLQEWTPPMARRPRVVAPWEEWTFWQFGFDGSNVRIDGIPACPIDRNVFRGDLDGLRRLALIDPDADTRPSLPNPSSEPTGIVHPDLNPSEIAHAIIDSRNRGDQ